MPKTETVDDKPAIIEALRKVYEAFYDLPCKTGKQFETMDAACAALTRYPKPKHLKHAD